MLPAQAGSVTGASVLKIFTVTESFGVNHPDQIIDFDYAGATSLNPADTCMIGPDGLQVPFQILSTDKLAVRTDLPAQTSKSWQLESGCTPNTAPYADQVTIDTSNPDYVQISNSLTGVRLYNFHGQTRGVPIASVSVSDGVAHVTTSVPNNFETVTSNIPDAFFGTSDLPVTISGLTGACSYLKGSWRISNASYWDASPTQFTLDNFFGANCSDTSGGVVTVAETDMAPIQGIELRDGSWSSGGVPLTTVNGYTPFNNKRMYAKNVTTTVVESGPLETIVKLSYAYVPIEYTISNVNNNTTIACARYGQMAPCKTSLADGYYTSTIRLEAGQPSIQIEDDTNENFSYYALNLYPQVQPDQGRYRGHGANTSVQGYLADGSVCGGFDSRPQQDCFRDFSYASPITTNYQSTDASSIAYMQAWNPWSTGTGWYWMLYKRAASSSAPVVGAFLGPASRAIGSNATGYSPYALPNDGTGQRAAGFEFYTNRTGPDASFFPTTRYDWGIFVGTKGNDLAAPTETQNINKQMNLHGGINLNKLYRYILTFTDPAKGYGGLFNDPSVVQAIIQKLRADPAGDNPYANTYLGYLYNTEPAGRALYDMWADATGAKTHASVVSAAKLAQSMLNVFVNGDGIYDFHDHYWMGGVQMNREVPSFDSILGDPTATTSDKITTKAVASLFAYILYDEDFVPLAGFNLSVTGNGLNAGTANMPIQQIGYRNDLTLFMPQHPFLGSFAESAISGADAALQSQVSAWGASASSPHYTGASAEPTLDSLLQGKMAGTDYFATDNPRLTRFAELLMQLSTPPEVRFQLSGNSYSVGYPASTIIPRKMFAEGDGSTEGTELTGIMAQGFRDANPTLAARLMGAWIAGGKTHSGFFASTIGIINEKAPSADPQLGSDNFPGYMSVLRNGWNTNQENAAWLLNGDYLSATGHRHDDRGTVMLYSLKAPLSINWGSIYYPQAGSGNMASIVMPDTSYSSVAWNGDNQPINSFESGWRTSTNTQFESFENSSMGNGVMTNANGLQWERKLYSLTPNANLPVVMIKDTFAGSNPTQRKVMTLNLMATGTVSTPAGPVLPPTRLASTAQTPDALPSVSRTITLAPGLNAFHFTGQSWPQHPSGGIDWDLYTVAGESQQAVIGNWGDSWHPGAEQNQYRAASGTSFTENQDILRVHGSSDFWTILLPYDKGSRPADLAVTQDSTSTDVIISRAGETIRVNDHFYSYSLGDEMMLTSFDASPVSANGMTIVGGSMEITLSTTSARLTFSGAPGARSFTLPGSWTVTGGIMQTGSVYRYDYESSAPVTIVLTGTIIVVPPDTTAPSVPTNLR